MGRNVTPSRADREEFQSLVKEIDHLQNRAELTCDTFQDFQSKVITLVFNNGSDEVVEEARDKATFYYESFLDIQIKIGKLTRRLTEITEK